MMAYRRWTEDEDTALVERYRFGIDALVEELGRTRRAIVQRARRLHLDGPSWQPNEDRVLVMCYPDHGPVYCQRYLPHRTIQAICSRARRIGVKRNLKKRRRDLPVGDIMAAWDFMLYGRRK